MRTVMSGPARVAYSQIYVESGADWADLGECFAGQQNGLCGAAVPGTLFLITGLHTGEVQFTVEVHDTMPTVEYDAEDVVEAPYRPIETAQLVSWGGSGSWALDLDPGADYRVRYSAWGMDAGHQAGPPMDGESSPDRYLLQFWPARSAPERIVKQTSRQAAYKHKAVREFPTPAELADQKREKARRAEEQRLAEHAAAWGGTLPTERLENVRFARELSALDRPLVDAFERTGPETLRVIARWTARRACVEAGFDQLEGIPDVLARMDRGDALYDALYGPRPPRLPDAPVTLGFGILPTSWDSRLDPFENVTRVVTAACYDDPLRAAIGTTWFGLGPFEHHDQLFAELRVAFPEVS
ncbi:hypothetical protein [Kribbella sp.]|uniref:hypothetical protein n=1 Tax=Kribbella sp. TaxID=1871183 RepID=UPI002D75254C|nr:hypothetical protein [Kribbella sp.]HZX04105.1 hypothetical protein [Kribbella sp.]